MLRWFDDWNNPKYAFKTTVPNPNATGRQRHTQQKWVLTEAGIMRFAIGARNNVAQEFADWVLLLVLPTIRKTGRFQVENVDEIKQLNITLQEKVANMKKEHDDAQEVSKKRVESLTSDIKRLKHRAEKLSCDTDKLEGDIEGLLDDIREKEDELEDAVEDGQLLAGYLNTCVGDSDLTRVMVNTPVAVTPTDTRDDLFMLRCSSFALLHITSYVLVKGFSDIRGRHMTTAEMNDAINKIMEVKGVLVNHKHTKNWITLYTFLAAIAKTRLGDDDYSTQMPLFHVYLYAKNLNEWTENKFGWTNCVPYADQIQAYYGPQAVAVFRFDRLNYANVQPNPANLAKITDFFSR